MHITASGTIQGVRARTHTLTVPVLIQTLLAHLLDQYCHYIFEQDCHGYLHIFQHRKTWKQCVS